MKTYKAFMQRGRYRRPPGQLHHYQAVTSAMAKVTAEAQYPGCLNAPTQVRCQFIPQLQRQPASTLHITAHRPSKTPGLASIKLNHSRARVMAVYSSSLVNTGFSASGNTSAVWLNSEPWDLCTVMENTVSTSTNRLGITKRTPPLPSLRGKATRRASAPSGPGTHSAMPISPFIRLKL